jgi:hypothetical protein
VKRFSGAIDKARNAVFFGFGRVFAAQFGEPAGGGLRFFEIEKAGV